MKPPPPGHFDWPDASSHSSCCECPLSADGNWHVFRKQLPDLPEHPTPAALDALAGRVIQVRTADDEKRPWRITGAERYTGDLYADGIRAYLDTDLGPLDRS